MGSSPHDRLPSSAIHNIHPSQHQDPKTPNAKPSGEGSHVEPGPAPMPPGWTDDAKEMGAEFYWNPTDGEGYELAEEYDLEKPEPVMNTTRDTGTPLCMFSAGCKSSAGRKYYVWNQIEDTVCEILSPASLDEIKRQIAKTDLVGVEMKLL